VANFFLSGFGAVSQGSIPYFWRYPQSLIGQSEGIAAMPITARSVQSFAMNRGTRL